MNDRFLFVIDPIETLNPEFDTSLLMIKELNNRGKEVKYCETENIYIEDGMVHARCKGIAIENQALYVDEVDDNILVSDFEKVLFRVDPPVNTTYYQSALMLSGQKNVINPTQKILLINEKIEAARLSVKQYNWCVTKDYRKAREFLEKNKKIVVKPINDYTGNRIFMLEKGITPLESITSVFGVVTNNGKEYMMLQEFFEEIYDGDKRVFVVRDEICGVINRLPAAGTFIANIHKGASYEKDSLKPIEEENVSRVMEWMKGNSVVMASLDFIGGRLTEINITSPSGIPQINQAYNEDFMPTVIDKIIEQ